MVKSVVRGFISIVVSGENLTLELGPGIEARSSNERVNLVRRRIRRCKNEPVVFPNRVGVGLFDGMVAPSLSRLDKIDFLNSPDSVNSSGSLDLPDLSVDLSVEESLDELIVRGERLNGDRLGECLDEYLGEGFGECLGDFSFELFFDLVKVFSETIGKRKIACNP